MPEKKRFFYMSDQAACIAVRWVIWIILLVVMAYSERSARLSPITVAICLFYAATNIALSFTPRETFAKPSVPYIIFLVDILLVSAVTFLSEGARSEFYVSYFLVIFMAAASTQLRNSILIAVAASGVYAFMVAHIRGAAALLTPGFIVRIPLFLIVGVLGGLLVARAQEERIQRELEKKTRVKPAGPASPGGSPPPSQEAAGFSHFTREMVHELKNPLGSISGFAQLLVRKSEEGNPKHRFALVILEQVERLNGFLNDISYFAKEIDKTRETVKVETLLEEAVKAIWNGEEEKPVLRYPPEGCPPLRANRSALDKAFRGILAGVRASRILGRRADISVVSGKSLLILVADGTAGLPEAALPNAFTPFVDLGPYGFGLSLAIAKKAVEAHGGTISVRREPERGTLFTLSLPLLPSESL